MENNACVLTRMVSVDNIIIKVAETPLIEACFCAWAAVVDLSSDRASMRVFYKNPLLKIAQNLLLKIAQNHLVNYPTPLNLNYSWNFGSLRESGSA